MGGEQRIGLMKPFSPDGVSQERNVLFLRVHSWKPPPQNSRTVTKVRTVWGGDKYPANKAADR